MKKLFSSIVFVLLLSLTNSFAQNKTAAATTPKQIAPINYGIVVDNSGSYRSILDRIIEIAKDIVEENKADDETFLVRFVSTDKIKLLQDFTVSKDELHAAVDEMYTEGGLTAILDAVEFSARHLAAKTSGEPARRKILILLTDGDDRQNKAKIEDVLKFLKDNKIQVFVVGISDEKVSNKVIDKLTKETGGKKFVPKTPAEVPAMIKDLTVTIRTP